MRNIFDSEDCLKNAYAITNQGNIVQVDLGAKYIYSVIKDFDPNIWFDETISRDDIFNAPMKVSDDFTFPFNCVLPEIS